ncbi:MAG TPA: hypothetical protein DCW29_15205 [Janthinobacterium sp.]|nr:hypothetical protein [Janthinobacterium sp.]
MLCGGAGQPAIPAATPAPLAKLLERASEDASCCATIDAQELDAVLVAAARAAFGPARFLPFNPAAPT